MAYNPTKKVKKNHTISCASTFDIDKSVNTLCLLDVYTESKKPASIWRHIEFIILLGDTVQTGLHMFLQKSKYSPILKIFASNFRYCS